MKKVSIVSGAEADAAVHTSRDIALAHAKPVSRRDILTKTAGGALAATAFGAVPLRGWAADGRWSARSWWRRRRSGT